MVHIMTLHTEFPVFLGEENRLIVGGMRRMATRADECLLGARISNRSSHRMEVRFGGILVALRAKSHDVCRIQQILEIR